MENNQTEDKQVENKQVETTHVDTNHANTNYANANHVDTNHVESTHTTTVKSTNERFLRSRKIVYYLFGALEVLLAFRFFFKILGANPKGTFVSLIYSVTNVLLAPFNSIFRTAVNDGVETKSILEPANLIAMIVYALIAYGIVKLIKIIAIRNNDEKDHSSEK